MNIYFFGVCGLCFWFTSAIAESANSLLQEQGCIETGIIALVAKKRAIGGFTYNKSR